MEEVSRVSFGMWEDGDCVDWLRNMGKGRKVEGLGWYCERPRDPSEQGEILRAFVEGSRKGKVFESEEVRSVYADNLEMVRWCDLEVLSATCVYCCPREKPIQ